MSDDYVQRFAAAAEQYCGLVEAGTWPRAAEMLLELAEALALLCAEALRLPDLPTESNDLPDSHLTTEQAQAVLVPFSEALASRRGDFADRDNDLSETYLSLTDDLGDVYRDVKEGLLLRAAGLAEAEVIWQWRFNFWAHWAEHATDALRALVGVLAYVGGASLEPRATRP
jgi:hypothetical protein